MPGVHASAFRRRFRMRSPLPLGLLVALLLLLQLPAAVLPDTPLQAWLDQLGESS